MSLTKTIKFKLRDDLKFTGREISAKLVIFKNKNPKGESVTYLFYWKYDKYFFIPIADIYLDANNRELIMPKGRPVYVASELSRDIIPSLKYKGFSVFAPDSDFTPIFKEVEFPDGRKIWIMVFDEIILHYYTWAVEYGDEEEWKEDYLSKHQIIIRKRRKEIEDSEEAIMANKMAQEMTDELFEEAGYDFMD